MNADERRLRKRVLSRKGKENAEKRLKKVEQCMFEVLSIATGVNLWEEKNFSYKEHKGHKEDREKCVAIRLALILP